MAISKSLIKTIIKVAVALNSCVASVSLGAPVEAYTYQMTMTHAHNKLSEINQELISRCGSSGVPMQTASGYSIPCVNGSNFLVSYEDAKLLENVLRAPFNTLINFIGDYLIASDPNQQVILPGYAVPTNFSSAPSNYSFSSATPYPINSNVTYNNPNFQYAPDSAAPPIGYGDGSYQHY